MEPAPYFHLLPEHKFSFPPTSFAVVTCHCIMQDFHVTLSVSRFRPPFAFLENITHAFRFAFEGDTLQFIIPGHAFAWFVFVLIVRVRLQTLDSFNPQAVSDFDIVRALFASDRIKCTNEWIDERWRSCCLVRLSGSPSLFALNYWCAVAVDA